MTCPHGQSRPTRKLRVATDLGYSRFPCRSCRRTCDEQTATPFHFLERPTDIVFQVVLFRLLFKLSLRDLMHLFLIRGYQLSNETAYGPETKFSLFRQLRGNPPRRACRWTAPVFPT
jgi:putative transposase